MSCVIFSDAVRSDSTMMIEKFHAVFTIVAVERQWYFMSPTHITNFWSIFLLSRWIGIFYWFLVFVLYRFIIQLFNTSEVICYLLVRLKEARVFEDSLVERNHKKYDANKVWVGTEIVQNCFALKIITFITKILLWI